MARGVRPEAQVPAAAILVSENILCVPPGLHKSGRPLGSMLPSWAAEEGLNFIHSSIHEYVLRGKEEVRKERGTIAGPRLMSNMLSSMPMAFNLFGHLREWPELAADAVREVLGVPVTSIDCIEVEYAPQPPSR